MSPFKPGIEAALLGGLLLAVTACTRVDADRFSGYAEADLVYVAPAIGGRLQSLGVERGARVKPGQMLFELERDPESLERATAAARAEKARLRRCGTCARASASTSCAPSSSNSPRPAPHWRCPPANSSAAKRW